MIVYLLVQEPGKVALKVLVTLPGTSMFTPWLETQYRLRKWPANERKFGGLNPFRTPICHISDYVFHRNPT